ncbi:MAG: DUF63 family protein [Candidatus Woesearchaeota archaeon]|nr:MAG: DUF63 family protein [Candidatus Woesearchaeota archaeon]
MALLMDINSFFDTYFSWNQAGFNYVNTVTYAIIALVAIYVIYKIFNRIKVKFNMEFFAGMFPFILLGSGLRALVDNGYVEESFWVVTPGIYLITAVLFLVTYLTCFFLAKKVRFSEWKLCGAIGIIFFIFLFGINGVRFNQPWVFLAIIGLAIVISIVLKIILKLLKQKKLSRKFSFLPIFGHMVDASATFIAVDFFGSWEKHPITRGFNEFMGTGAALFILKLIVLLPAVYLIATEIKDKNFRNFLLIVLATLGFAEGLRNALTLII